MKVDPVKVGAENLLLPLALFGFLAPIATFLIAIASIASEIKIAILSILVGGYTLMFVLSYKRFSRSGDPPPAQTKEDSILTGPALAAEDSGSPAYIDAVTGLPNLAALQLVLERELAESARNPDDRPLSVLAIDIEGSPNNSDVRDPAADARDRAFAAGSIKGCLRAMDFAAQSSDDEFLVILPAAGEAGAAEIVLRIETAFSQREAELEGMRNTALRPYIGVVTFHNDGETAGSLIRSAIAKSREAKARSTKRTTEGACEYVN